MRNITVLMTGAGAPGAAGIIKCLRLNGEREIRIVGADMQDHVGTSCMLDGFERICPVGDPGFCRVVLDAAKKHNADVILPLVTKELERFAADVDMFENEGVKVCICPLDNLKAANDKGMLLKKMEENGIPVPEYVRVDSADGFAGACAALGYPEKPVCFKPTRANGSRGFRIINDRMDRGYLLFNEKPNSTYITFEDVLSILKSMQKIPELLVMEYLPGSEYSVDMLADDGRVIAAVPRKRLAMNGGISVNCVNVYNEEILDYCARIVDALHLDGNIGVQVRENADGNFRILEINPRVQGTIVACLASGVNFPYLAIKRKLGEKLPDISIKWNVEMRRFWDEVYFDDDGTAFSLT